VTLYPSESEIALLVLGSKRAKEWPRIAQHLENKHGLPAIDPEMGGRFWPAVHAYFHTRHGMGLDGAAPTAPQSNRVRVVPFKPDGQERSHGQETPTAFDRRHSGRDHR
jgi:hypothetical protein